MALMKHIHTNVVTSTDRFAKALAVSNSPCPLAQMDQTSRSQILFYIKIEGGGGGTSVERNNVTQLNSVN